MANQAVLDEMGIDRWVATRPLPGAKFVQLVDRYALCTESGPVGVISIDRRASDEAISVKSERLIDAMLRSVGLHRGDLVEGDASPCCLTFDTNQPAIQFPHPQELLSKPADKASLWRDLREVSFE